MNDIRDDFETMIAQSEKVPENFKLKHGTKSLTNLIKIITPLL